MTDAPSPDPARSASGTSNARVPRGPIVLLVLVAWAFLPVDQVPTFDTLKTLVLLLGVAVMTVAHGVRKRGVAVRDGDPLLLVGAGLLGVALVTALFTGPRSSLEGPLLALGVLAAARLVAREEDGRAAVISVARGAALAAAGAGLYALLQRAGFDPTPWGVRREVASTFGNVSFAAEFQAAALPFALLLVAGHGRRVLDRVLGSAALLLGATHLVLAQSRIDLIAAAAAVVVVATLSLWSRGRRNTARALGGAAAAGAVAAAALFVRMAGGAESALLGRGDTVAIRSHIWSSFGDMLTGVPLWLPGTAPFVDLYPPYRAAEEFRLSMGRLVTTPHNDYLGLVAALGVVLALVALGGCAAFGRRLLRGLGARDDAPFVAAIAGALAALSVSALASSPLVHGATALLAGLAVGAALALRPAPSPVRAVAAWPVGHLVSAALVIAVVPVIGMVRSDTFVANARQAFAEGRLRDSLRVYEIAAAADARAHDARHELGTILLNRREYTAAESALRAARDVRPNSPDTQANLARSLLAQGRTVEAQTLLDAGIAACPWHPELLSTRAQFALSEGRGAQAVADFTAAKRLLGHEPRIDALIAEARLVATPGGPAHEEALRVLKELLSRGDRGQVARSVPAMLARDPSLLPALVATARRLVKSEPESAAVLVAAAAESPVARSDVGYLEEAGAVLLRAGWKDAGSRFSGRALGLRAQAAYERGENQLAARLAAKAEPRDPDPAHCLVLARAFAKLDQRKAAIEAIGTAVLKGPVDPEAIRADPVLGDLLPDERLELILQRAGERLGDDQ